MKNEEGKRKNEEGRKKRGEGRTKSDDFGVRMCCAMRGMSSSV
jgi:hypothetical protein